MSSGTTPSSKSPQLSPSGFTRHLRIGSVRIPQHNLTTRTELWDFIKLSALYLSVHMELSLRLSFYLRRSLEGYRVGSTTGFPVEIVEALALQYCHQILWKCPQYHMSTYSAHRRLTSFDHQLNGGLGGYYRGNVPRVPWAAGHGPKILDTIGSLQRQLAREPYTPYQGMSPPLQAEEEGPPTKKELIPGMIHFITSSPYD
jgi:hypothetical protein